MFKNAPILCAKPLSTLGRVSLLLLLVIGGLVFSFSAKADTIQTFSFSGTLDCASCGTTSVTGSFAVISNSAGEEVGLGAWSFTTPFGTESSSDSGSSMCSGISEFGKGQETIAFADLSTGINLRFFFPDTDPFSGGAITGGTTAGAGISRITTFTGTSCFVPPDVITGEFSLLSGTMTASSPVTPTPELPSFLLFGTGLLGLVAAVRFADR